MSLAALPLKVLHITKGESKETRRRQNGEHTKCGLFIDYSHPEAFTRPPKGSPWCEHCLEMDG